MSLENPSNHNGHTQSNPDHISSSTNVLLKEKLKLVLDYNEPCILSGVISNLLTHRSISQQWLPKDLRNLNKKMRSALGIFLYSVTIIHTVFTLLYLQGCDNIIYCSTHYARIIYYIISYHASPLRVAPYYIQTDLICSHV